MGRRRRHPARVALICLTALTTGCAATVGPVGASPSEDLSPAASPTATTSGWATARAASTISPETVPRPSRSSARAITANAILAAAVADGTLRGKTILIDPGHNGANSRNPKVINRKVFIGNGTKACDTTGTETNAGYPEYAFNLDVSTQLASMLRSAGAAVVLTRTTNTGVGPCITERAAAATTAGADVAISIHADGAASAERGFHVIVPGKIGRNNAIVAPSRQLGIQVRDAFRAGTSEPLSTYAGTRTGAVVVRSDLGGLNLSTVPKIFIECGNMRNATDARQMTTPAWRRQAATALAAGLTSYLVGQG